MSSKFLQFYFVSKNIAKLCTNAFYSYLIAANAENISSELQIISAKASQFSALDMDLTVSKLEELIKFKSNITQRGRNNNIARTMSNILGSSSNALWQSEQESKTISR